MKKKHNPSRKWIWLVLIIVVLLALNECFYLAYTQFRCTRKINRGERPNLYELASAWQMHSSLWMFGWVVDANTAWACFNKQFHLESCILRPDVPQDETVKRAKAQLLAGKRKRIRLLWCNINTRASIYMNGGYISIHRDDSGEYFKYEIPMDYSPGIVNVIFVPISQTVLDYMERTNILSVYTETRYERIER